MKFHSRFGRCGFVSLCLTVSLASAKSVGVISLSNNTNDASQAWISRGLADMLSTDLAKLSSVTVVQREQLDKVLKEQALGASGVIAPSQAAQLGKVLGAETLLTGSYASIGKNIRVDLQLIDATTGQVQGAVSAEGNVDSIFSLEKQLVLSLLTKLNVTPTGPELQAISQGETFNSQAIALNYQALLQLPTQPQAAIDTFKKALALDPSYASAQKNLQNALTVSGSATANVAIVNAQTQKVEIEAVKAALQVIKSSIRLTDFKFVDGEQYSYNDKLGHMQLYYTGTVKLAPDAPARLIALLEPFSREGSGRSPFIIKGKGLGRQDMVVLNLSNESLSVLRPYFEPYHGWNIFLGFYGQGGHASAVESIEDGTGWPLYSNSEHPTFDVDAVRTFSGSDSLPISLVKNITSEKVFFAIRNTNSYYTRAYTYINAANAKQFNVPVGYLWTNPLKELGCAFTYQGSDGVTRTVEVNEIYPLKANPDMMTGLKGGCVIYTKLNDADFSPERITEYLESGRDFTVTRYEMDKARSATRARWDLTSVDKAADRVYGGVHIIEDALFVQNGDQSTTSFYFEVQQGIQESVYLNNAKSFPFFEMTIPF